MTTKGDKQQTKSALERNGHAPSDDRRVGLAADPEVPNFISEILAQYKDLLVQHVETVKNKAVTEVKEEALLLHSQAELRLRSMESEVQEGVQAVLDRAREAIFEMVRAEMGDIFEEMESRLQALLDTGESEAHAEDLENAEDPAEGDLALESLLEGTREGEGGEDQGAEADYGERDVSHTDVRLDLPPPLDPRRLLGFYRGLSATKDIRILRALGSLDKGVNLYIRPRELSSVTDLLRELPGVDDVTEDAQRMEEEEDGGTSSADTHLTLKISLAAAGKR